MSGPALGRREFLSGVAALAAAGLAAAGGVSLPACAGADPLEGALRAFFADPAAARAVGAEVIALEKVAPRAGTVVERLARGRGEALRALAASDAGALADALREQHRADFVEGRVVVVRGWVLSETESQLLALAALR
jgi:hypothetical protein